MKKTILFTLLLCAAFVSAIEVDINLSRGWNLIAMPCSTEFDDIIDILPIVPPAYIYSAGSGYIPIMTFPRLSEGFFVLSLADTNIHISCECVDDTLDETRIIDYTFGDSCLGYGEKTTPLYDIDSMEITVDHCLINLNYIAWFNCCVDSVTMSLYSTAGTINIIENEYTSTPCFCDCPFEISSTIQVRNSGTYEINILYIGLYSPDDTILVWAGEVEVTDCP